MPRDGKKDKCEHTVHVFDISDKKWQRKQPLLKCKPWVHVCYWHVIKKCGLFQPQLSKRRGLVKLAGSYKN